MRLRLSVEFTRAATLAAGQPASLRSGISTRRLALWRSPGAPDRHAPDCALNWQSVFYILGTVGVMWAVIWYSYYRDDPREHAAVNSEEVRVIAVGPQLQVHNAKAPVPWRCILASRDLWYLSAMYFCYGWVLWLYLQWLPTYFIEARHFTAIKTGLAASIPLLAATVTNIAGGWISDKLAHRWSDLRRGRSAFPCRVRGSRPRAGAGSVGAK